MAATLDWRDEGAVTPIQDQGSCGACWTFMTTGALEGAYKIAGGELYNLSEQQVLDCQTEDSAAGCSGGAMSSGFDYFLDNKAINATDYPYTATQGTCISDYYNATDISVQRWNWITSYDGEQIKAALNKGPVGVAINGGSFFFNHYKSGIFNCTRSSCGDSVTDLNHAVLLVGYGAEDGTEYFILKN